MGGGTDANSVVLEEGRALNSDCVPSLDSCCTPLVDNPHPYMGFPRGGIWLLRNRYDTLGTISMAFLPNTSKAGAMAASGDSSNPVGRVSNEDSIPKHGL